MGFKKGNKLSSKPIVLENLDNGCVVCTSHYTDKEGYVYVCVNRKRIGLHKYVYTKTFGDVPEGYVVRHSCDNPSCVNIEHLSVGMQADNIQDKMNKGRQAKGEKIGTSKLKEDDVLQIRSLKGIKTSRQTAKMFNIGKTTVQYIWSGKLWSYLASSDDDCYQTRKVTNDKRRSDAAAASDQNSS